MATTSVGQDMTSEEEMARAFVALHERGFSKTWAIWIITIMILFDRSVPKAAKIFLTSANQHSYRPHNQPNRLPCRLCLTVGFYDEVVVVLSYSIF